MTYQDIAPTLDDGFEDLEHVLTLTLDKTIDLLVVIDHNSVVHLERETHTGKTQTVIQSQ